MTADHQGEIAFEGLAVLTQSEQGPLLRPVDQGRGGRPLRLDPDWLTGFAPGPGITIGQAALVQAVVVADRHPDVHGRFAETDDGPVSVDVELRHALEGGEGMTLLARAKLKATGGAMEIVGHKRSVTLDWLAPLLAGLASDVKVDVDELPPSWGYQVLQHSPAWLAEVGVAGADIIFQEAPAKLADHAIRVTTARAEKQRVALAAPWEDFQAAVEGFVNPYTFIRLHDGPPRGTPAGHASLLASPGSSTIHAAGARWAGSFRVTFTARTPLALWGRETEDAEGNSIGAPHRLADGTYVLPGSSIAGLARSQHELLTDSCYRVLNSEFLPVHRDPAVPSHPSRLGVMINEEEIRLCDPVVHAGSEYPALWIEAHRFAPGSVISGDPYHLDFANCVPSVTSPGRLDYTSGHLPQRCVVKGCPKLHWVVIVSAAALPNRRREPGDKQVPHRVAFAPLGVEVRALGAALQAYRDAADGAGDVVWRRQHPKEILNLQVPPLVRRHQVIGHRQEVKDTPYADQVLWVNLDGTAVTRVRPSILWRAAGKHAVEKRVAGYRQCRKADELCPSCALFGMAEERSVADQKTSKNEAARVKAYRGHVRFSTGVISTVDEVPTRLVEMGQPRPGSGQFYLDNNHIQVKQAAKEQRPLREWGSAADTATVRKIAGRKRYWLSSEPTTRYQATDTANANMVSRHRLVPAAATVTATVTFDGLTCEQLGGLLAALSPQLLAESGSWSQIAPHLTGPLAAHVAQHGLGVQLGRGKAVGLGVCTSAVSDLTAQGPGRYRGENPHRAPSIDDAVSAFVTALGDAGGRWPSLMSVAAINRVPSQLIGYPPDNVPNAEYKFDFWKRTTGAHGTVDGYAPALVSLPAPTKDELRVPRPWMEGEF